MAIRGDEREREWQGKEDEWVVRLKEVEERV
jgi:hypothetical protein